MKHEKKEDVFQWVLFTIIMLDFALLGMIFLQQNFKPTKCENRIEVLKTYFFFYKFFIPRFHQCIYYIQKRFMWVKKFFFYLPTFKYGCLFSVYIKFNIFQSYYKIFKCNFCLDFSFTKYPNIIHIPKISFIFFHFAIYMIQIYICKKCRSWGTLWQSIS